MSKNYRNLVGLLVIYARPQRASTQSQTSFSVYSSSVLRHRRVGRARNSRPPANPHPLPRKQPKTNAIPRFPTPTNPFLHLPTQSATLTNAFPRALCARTRTLSRVLYIGVRIFMLIFLHML